MTLFVKYISSEGSAMLTVKARSPQSEPVSTYAHGAQSWRFFFIFLKFSPFLFTEKNSV